MRYVFAGNRSAVLRRMFALGLDVRAVFAVPGSHLEAELRDGGVPHRPMPARDEFFAEVGRAEFDVFVSNGCPFILPVSRLRRGGQLFVNIHPSLLPDLRGNHPVNAALLFGRGRTGATCHLMDDGIDTGAVLSRVEFAITPDLDIGLLYLLCFEAEGRAFAQAHAGKFLPVADASPGERVYYSRRPEHLALDLSKSAGEIRRRVRAFGLASQGAHFIHRGATFKVMDAEVIVNEFFLALAADRADREVIHKYDDNIVIKTCDGALVLKRVSGDPGAIRVGDVIG
jgi:methionyl-tRNA formyltransferase